MQGTKVVRPFPFFRAGARASQPQLSKPILVLEDVYKFFRPDQPTLRGVDLSVERGEFAFITGPSGAGKSTLLKLVYRELRVDEGRVLFCGRDIGRLTDKSIPFLRRNLGIVFQDFRIIDHWTVFENVAVALEIVSMPQRLIRSRVAARAIVPEPALILADEPTGNLDPHLAIDILTLFEEINSTGTTVLFATHDHSLISKRDHRLISIDEGRVSEAQQGLKHWQGSSGIHTLVG
jgi:cell division transport system ATP-binding protein